MTASRQKGATRERELAKLLGQALDDGTISRNLEQTRDGGYDLRGRALRRFAVEAKSAEQVQWGTWLNQARRQAEEGGLVPVVAHRRNGGTWSFVCELDLLQFAALVRFFNLLNEGKHL